MDQLCGQRSTSGRYFGQSFPVRCVQAAPGALGAQALLEANDAGVPHELGRGVSGRRLLRAVGPGTRGSGSYGPLVWMRPNTGGAVNICRGSTRARAAARHCRPLRGHREQLLSYFGLQDALQRCHRGPRQQGGGHDEKILRLPDLQRDRARTLPIRRLVSCPGRTRPQIVLTSQKKERLVGTSRSRFG